LRDCLSVLGDRKAVLARELTKMFETIKFDDLSVIADFVAQDKNQQKGEIVLLIEGAKNQVGVDHSEEMDRLLRIMLEELPMKQAATIIAKILGIKKNSVYQRALELK
jgi:16S rRNA (cytidine1402-2'-O)-methyltransferase